jgi:nuclear transport factor 2 (NTF2) superfamily protein
MTSDNITPTVARITPPFTRETARAQVKAAENAWNSRDPEIVAQAYTENGSVAIFHVRPFRAVFTPL